MKKYSSVSVLGLSLLLVSCSGLMQKNSLAPPHAPLIEGQVVPVIAHPNIKTLLSSQDENLSNNKQLVFDMWRTILNAGHVDKMSDFFAENYIEHSQLAPTGREAYKKFVAGSVKYRDNIPQTIVDPVVTIIAENNFVAVASVANYFEPNGSGDTYTSSHFDLFRIENNLIAEHWDSSQILKGQRILPQAEGGPKPVVGIEGVDQLDMLQNPDSSLANNKRLVFDNWRHTSEAGREEMALLYLDPIYIQHNPNAVTGRAGFMEYFAKRPDTSIEMFLEAPLITIIAEGDLVVQALQGERPDPNDNNVINVIAWFDMFRVQDGRLIEHWDTASKGEVPTIMKDQLKEQL